MKTKFRIASIVKANSLDFSITGLQTFDLGTLQLPTNIEFELPANIRLGHLVEKIVSHLIKASTNYKVLYENIQVIEDKKTIGEIDFIIKMKIQSKLSMWSWRISFISMTPAFLWNQCIIGLAQIGMIP